jgi:hypothetical protein
MGCSPFLAGYLPCRDVEAVPDVHGRDREDERCELPTRQIKELTMDTTTLEPRIPNPAFAVPGAIDVLQAINKAIARPDGDRLTTTQTTKLTSSARGAQRATRSSSTAVSDPCCSSSIAVPAPLGA